MKLGIDVLKDEYERILGKLDIVLITGSSTIDSSGIPVYQTIKKLAGKRLKAVWSLQHGFFIDKQDNMILSDSFYWKDFDINIRSLYGKHLLPHPDWIENVDALVIDVFDVGTRVYTFVNHILMIMKMLSGKNINIIVLDRPNPLNGLECEGNVIDENYFSIVGQIPVPMRHSLTPAEYLSFGLIYHDIELQLEVVMMKSWKRSQLFKGIWTYPSPNMPLLSTAIVYPGAVMLEGTNLSEGRGTTRPFELIGAPFIDNLQLVKELELLQLNEVKFIPVFFKPEYSKFSGEVCKGLLVQVENREIFNSFQVYYEIIRLIARLYPEEFKWKQPPYEFEYIRLPIDMICGSDLIRRPIDADKKFPEIKLDIDREIQEFRDMAVDHLLYP